MFAVRKNANRAPVWPVSVVGSITHSKGIASCIAANIETVAALGIDIEHFIDPLVGDTIEQQVLTNEDKIFFKNNAHKFLGFIEFLTLVFSAKESIYKALYPSVNHFFDFSAVSITDFNSSSLTFKLNQNLSANYSLSKRLKVSYSLFDDYVKTWVIISQ